MKCLSFAARVRTLRKAEILKASLAVREQKGCRGATIDRIAAAAGVGKGTLYKHFASETELLEAALEAGTKQLGGRCRTAWAGGAPNSKVAFRRVINELVAMTLERNGAGPEALWRLRCGLTCMCPGKPPSRAFERELGPLVAAWQAGRLIDPAVNPDFLANAIAALTAALPSLPNGQEAATSRRVQLMTDQVLTLLCNGRARHKAHGESRGGQHGPVSSRLRRGQTPRGQ